MKSIDFSVALEDTINESNGINKESNNYPMSRTYDENFKSFCKFYLSVISVLTGTLVLAYILNIVT